MEQAIAHLGLLEDEAIVLDTAALEVAALDHGCPDLTGYTDLLVTISERVAVLGVNAMTSLERAGVLGHVIGDEFGLEGDRATYDRPENADLIRVIERRRGLPVSLTILYVAAARRVGWEADALNTPGHVIGRIGGGTDPVLIDPFAKGAVLEGEDLTALLAGALGRSARPTSSHLAAMSNRAILVRLLMNQASRAEANGNARRALTLYTRMTTIAPDQPHPWWERARLEVAHGEPAAARASLSAILEITREPGMRSHIHKALEALASLSD